MKRIIAAFILLAFGSVAVWADSDAIAQRRDLMKANGKAAKALVDMLKGAPFDLTTVQASLKTFMNAAEKMPKLFPEDSKTRRRHPRPAGDLGKQGGRRRAFCQARVRLVRRSQKHNQRSQLQGRYQARVRQLRRLPRTLQGQDRVTPRSQRAE
jgi:Cytochrome C'